MHFPQPTNDSCVGTSLLIAAILTSRSVLADYTDISKSAMAIHASDIYRNTGDMLRAAEEVFELVLDPITPATMGGLPVGVSLCYTFSANDQGLHCVVVDTRSEAGPEIYDPAMNSTPDALYWAWEPEPGDPFARAIIHLIPVATVVDY